MPNTRRITENRLCVCCCALVDAYQNKVKRNKVPENQFKKTTQAAKKLLTSIKEKGPHRKKSPFTRKRRKQSSRLRRVAGRQASRV